jgi:hypothetical protein
LVEGKISLRKYSALSGGRMIPVETIFSSPGVPEAVRVAGVSFP